MASSSNSTGAATMTAAGIAAVFGGAAFLTATPSSTGNLRAVAVEASIPRAAPSATSAGVATTSQAALGTVGLASAVLFAGLGARRATGVSSTSQKLVTLNAFESELGVQAPVGFWDPAGFTADGSSENFARRRQTELKHGRVSM
jgi:hypothetical protein